MFGICLEPQLGLKNNPMKRLSGVPSVEGRQFGNRTQFLAHSLSETLKKQRVEVEAAHAQRKRRATLAYCVSPNTCCSPALHVSLIAPGVRALGIGS